MHEVEFVPPREEITIEDFEKGTTKEVTMHDGSVIVFKKLSRDYDPTNRTQAISMLEEAIRRNWLVTGLIYVNPDHPTIFDSYKLGDVPLNRLNEEDLRPNSDSLEMINLRFS